MANAAQARGDLAGAESLFAESLALSRRLAQELATPEARRDVSVYGAIYKLHAPP